MSEHSYCGQSCLFRDLSEEAFPLSVSNRPEEAWVSGNRVVRLISPTGHAAGHPLYSSSEAGRAERRRLLLVLRERPVAHVLPVTRLCECSFETPFVEGVPLRDFGLGPDAKRLTHPHSLRPTWAPEALQAFLKELASGLAGLHALGIAHGDPALMNTLIVEEGGAKAAIWLDLNTVRSATEENKALDVAGFIELCLWPSLLEAPAYSPSLFSAIADRTSRAPEVLAAARELLGTPYTDYQSGDIRAAFAAALRNNRHLHRTDLFGGVHRTLCACLAPAYFLDQTVSAQNYRFIQAVLGAEQTRHRIMEEEVTRLHYLRFEDELRAARQAAADLDQWSKQLQDAVHYHEQRATAAESRTADLAGEVARLRNRNREAEIQIANLQLDASRLRQAEAELAEVRDWSRQLQKAALYHEHQAAGAQRELQSIRSSRTWRAADWAFRWVRRLRLVRL